jgi:hypothetical protein
MSSGDNAWERDFARLRMKWLEAVQDDPQISAAGFSLTFAIARHLNRKTGDAWPSQKTLGDLARVRERQVRNLLRDLVARGHLTIKSGGFQRPDRYRPAFTDRRPIAALDRQPTAALEAPDRQSSDRVTGTVLPPNPLREPFEKNATRRSDEKRLAEEIFALMPKASAGRANLAKVEKAIDDVVASGTAPQALRLAVQAFVEQSPDAKEQDGRFMGAADKWLTHKRGWEAYLPSADRLYCEGYPKSDYDWLLRVRTWQRVPSLWKTDDHGPPPGQPGCRAPAHVIGRALGQTEAPRFSPLGHPAEGFSPVIARDPCPAASCGEPTPHPIPQTRLPNDR